VFSPKFTAARTVFVVAFFARGIRFSFSCVVYWERAVDPLPWFASRHRLGSIRISLEDRAADPKAKQRQKQSQAS
jgi:hypothetical protein